MTILFSILPAILYILLVYLSTPFGSIDTNKSAKYVLAGSISTILVLIFSLIVPMEPRFMISNGSFYEPSLTTFFYEAFVQVAFVEELLKFGMYYLVYKFLSAKDKNNSFSILFNTMLVGTGFAMIENIIYTFRFQENVPDTILLRTFSAVLIHMACGIIMGYFIALGNKSVNYSKGISEFDIWMKRNPKHKRTVYTIFGILFAILAHGLYDFNIFVQLGYSIEISIGLLLTAYFLFRDLKKKEFGTIK